MATDAPSAILAITGQAEIEARDAALRFTAIVLDASPQHASDPAVAACALFAARAFGGDEDAWPSLVAAVRDVLALASPKSTSASRSHDELRAFVAENADLLDD